MKNRRLTSVFALSAVLAASSAASAMDLLVDGMKIPCPAVDALEAEPGFDEKYDKEEPVLMGKLSAATEACVKNYFKDDTDVEIRMKHADSLPDALSFNPFNAYGADGRPKSGFNSPPWFRI